MNVQTMHSGNAKPTSVFIPINDWVTMKEKYQNLSLWGSQSLTKIEILAGIKEVMEEMKLMKLGK